MKFEDDLHDWYIEGVILELSQMETGHQIEDSDISSGSPSFQADYIYLGDRPIGLVLPGSGLHYYHGDQLTTPQLVTGNLTPIQWTGAYQPFGTVAVTGSITQNLRLPGQYADAETGWSNNGWVGEGLWRESSV